MNKSYHFSEMSSLNSTMSSKPAFQLYIWLQLCYVLTVTAKQPNVILMLADDYGWNDIGYHGSEIQTPNLDDLAAKGVKLENYYVQPTCTPSRSQLLSGRYQIHTGLQHGIIQKCVPNGIPLTDTLLSAKLKEAGYSTHAIGKWHVGFFKDEYTPTHRGFDTFTGFFGGGEDYYTKSASSNRRSAIDFAENGRGSNDSYGVYSTHYYAQKAQDVIESHDQSKPLFMYLPFQSPHTPLQVPDEYEQMYSHISDSNRRIYAGMVSAMDEAVGNITRTLVDTGMWENTILIFSTDNGGQTGSGASNSPLRGRKGTYWEGGIRGVGFITGPLLQRSGVISHKLMHISDWYPTLVNLAGGSLSGTQLDGYDVWDVINEDLPSPRQEILHNIDPLYDRKGTSVSDIFDTSVQAALRQGDWKILTGDPGFDKWVPDPTSTVSLRRGRNESCRGSRRKRRQANDSQNVYLFNVANDPNECNELSAQHPDRVNQLLQVLADYNRTAVEVRYPASDHRCNPARHGGYWRPWQ